MNEKQFTELLYSVRDMGRHVRGEHVEGVRVQEVSEPKVKVLPESSSFISSDLQRDCRVAYGSSQ